MIVATVAGLTLSGGQPVAAPSRQPISRKVVYVDLDALARMHPAWQAVTITGSAINDAGAGSLKISGPLMAKKTVHFKAHIPDTDPAIRQQLVSEAIRVSDDAMMKLENAQLEAADMRLRQRRETMEKSVEAEVMASVREINEKAYGDVEQIARKHCSDKINAELKVAALKLQSGKPGIDDKSNAAKLESAEADLMRINGECSDETNGVLGQAKTQTASLWANAASRTDAALLIIESSERRKIKNRAAASRNEILRELLSLYDADSSIAAMRPSGRWSADMNLSRVALASPGRMDIGKWYAQNSQLQKRIRQNIKSAVSKMAMTQGVRVVFSRVSNNIPDQTKRFARLMSERAWDGCDPVLSMVGES